MAGVRYCAFVSDAGNSLALEIGRLYFGIGAKRAPRSDMTRQALDRSRLLGRGRILTLSILALKVLALKILVLKTFRRPEG